MELIDEIEVGNELGEGVIWDNRSQCFMWTDIVGRTLYQYDPYARHLEQWSTPERLCCFAPVEIQGKRAPALIAAFESGFAYYSPQSCQVVWIEKIKNDYPAIRLNDGRTDRFGNFWSGGMVEDHNHGGKKARLYCLDRSLNLHSLIDDISISNSLCWSPDSKYLYHCDTPSRRIYRYDFDPNGPTLSNRREHIKTERGCYPDGSIVDSQGFVWNAQWAGSKVVRYTPNGEIDFELEVPVSQPTCVAFGGKDLNLLCVTSAHQDLSSSQRAADPRAGNVFVYQTEYLGLIEQPFKPNPDQALSHF